MSKIKIKSKLEIDRMRASCRLAAEILQRAGELVKPGISTEEINTFVHDYTIRNHAYPSPLNYHGFPKSVCTSVNDCVTHGIPTISQVLKEGDIINIDVTCTLEGYHGDCSATFPVGKISREAHDLVEAARDCLAEGILASGRPGARFGDIGQAIDPIAQDRGYSVVRDYCGHGIGRGFHEDPLVLHYASNQRSEQIREGMCFTIEPMINQGTWKVKQLKDGWTVLTADGLLSAQFEHTLAVTSHGIEILTKLD